MHYPRQTQKVTRIRDQVRPHDSGYDGNRDVAAPAVRGRRCQQRQDSVSRGQQSAMCNGRKATSLRRCMLPIIAGAGAEAARLTISVDSALHTRVDLFLAQAGRKGERQARRAEALRDREVPFTIAKLLHVKALEVNGREIRPARDAELRETAHHLAAVYFGCEAHDVGEPRHPRRRRHNGRHAQPRHV